MMDPTIPSDFCYRKSWVHKAIIDLGFAYIEQVDFIKSTPLFKNIQI